MRSFTITNADNTKMNVDLIRYFKFKTDCFLIYSIGEVDDKNYKKLYLVRIMEELGFPVVQTIKNEADWANMQGIVKKVLKELKKNSKKLTEDLDYREIEGIKIVEPRFFKLDAKLVDILASNYMEGDTTNMSQETINTLETSVVNENVEQQPVVPSVENIPPVEPLPIYNDSMDQLMPNVAAVDAQIDNESNEETTLESIDQAIMNQGEFKPIELNKNSNEIVDDNVETQNVVSNDVPSINNMDEQITPIIGNVESNAETTNVPSVEPLQPIAEVNETQNIDSVPATPIVESSIEPITPQEEIKPINNVETTEVESQETPVVEKQEPNYKELYEAIKADNDATNNLLTDVLNELNMYKEKYGELN